MNEFKLEKFLYLSYFVQNFSLSVFISWVFKKIVQTKREDVYQTHLYISVLYINCTLLMVSRILQCTLFHLVKVRIKISVLFSCALSIFRLTLKQSEKTSFPSLKATRCISRLISSKGTYLSNFYVNKVDCNRDLSLMHYKGSL